MDTWVYVLMISACWSRPVNKLEIFSSYRIAQTLRGLFKSDIQNPPRRLCQFYCIMDFSSLLGAQICSQVSLH